MPSFARELEQTLHNALGEASRAPPRICDARASADRADRRRACVEGHDRLRRQPRRAARHASSNISTMSSAPWSPTARTDPTPTSGFQRVVQRAILHVQSSGRDEVTGANVLVALFSERESYAVYFLQQQDMSRLDAVTYISHGVGKGDTHAETRERRAAPRKRPSKSEGKKESALKQFTVDLNEKAAAGQGRSADRPHARGRPHGADPLPPVEEQPALCRRSRRRQNRHRRRPRAQDHRRRRSRRAQGRGDLRARHGRAARRHPLPRRLRGAAEVGRHRAREAARTRSCSSTRSTR